MRRTPLVLLVVALVLSLGGCGTEEKKDAPLELGDSTDQPSQSAAPSPSEEQQPFDAKGSEVLRGQVAATTPEQEAVVDAWFDYWEVRARSYGQAEVDPALGQFAAATAVSDVVGYVRHLQHDKLPHGGRHDVRREQGPGGRQLGAALQLRREQVHRRHRRRNPGRAARAFLHRRWHPRAARRAVAGGHGQGRGDPAGLPLAMGVTSGLSARCTG